MTVAHTELKYEQDLFNMAVIPFGASGRLISTENITSRVNDRESLARAQRLALIGRMLAQITHEVRNPLNAMSLNAEMLEEELNTEDGREMLEIISKEIHRLEETTNGIWHSPENAHLCSALSRLMNWFKSSSSWRPQASSKNRFSSATSHWTKP